MLVDQKKLDLYVDKNFNVLFEGERGVGKTSVIFSTFNKAGLRVKYFSAPTMDPWTDLVGVPSTIIRDDGKEVLKLIPPEDFVDEKYDVIFIDELNRAPKKVMNALMELIQFKTINGKPYNIKMIWAAINPCNEEDEYHVEPLDPAVRDRFQIQIKFPYKVDYNFFTQSFGNTGTIFCQWWDNQPENIKKEVSPRRLFEAASFYIDGGDLTDIITVGNTKKLKEDLRSASQLTILENDFKNNSINKSKPILNKNYSNTISDYFKSNQNIFNFFLPYLNKEWMAKEFTEKSKIFTYMLKISNSTNENKALVDGIITNIVSINPKRNNILKENWDSLSGFLSENDKKNIENLILEEKESLKSKNLHEKESLKPKNLHEVELIRLIDDEILMNKKTYLTGSDLSHYDYKNMLIITKYASELIAKNQISIDRAKMQISERIGAVFSIVNIEGKINASMFKIRESITNPQHKSYIWNKILQHKPYALKQPSINSQFKDLGEIIKDVMKKNEGKTAHEIKEEYINLTLSSNKKKLKRI